MWAWGEREEGHPKYVIYRQRPPQTLLCIALWHQPSDWTHREWQKLCDFTQFTLFLSSQWHLFSLSLWKAPHGVRQCSTCLLISPWSNTGFVTGSASHSHSTVVLMCQTATPLVNELIKQERARDDLSKATVAHKQSSCVTWCRPFILPCGCCFHGSQR